MTPSSLVLAGRLIEVAGNHPDFELWVADRVSRSYAASILRRPVRLLPPGMAGLGSVLHGLGSRQMGLAAALPTSADMPFEARWRSLDSWHEGSDREAAGRLGHVLARLAGAAPLLRTAALQEAWALILPGWAALAAGEDLLVTETLDTALFAALSGLACRLRAIAPGAEAFIATWAHVLEPLELGFEPPVQEVA